MKVWVGYLKKRAKNCMKTNRLGKQRKNQKINRSLFHEKRSPKEEGGNIPKEHLKSGDIFDEDKIGLKRK